MAQISEGSLSDDEFVEASVIEAFVPNDTNLSIKEEIKAWNGEHKEESSSLLPIVEQRQFLLLGKWSSRIMITAQQV